MSTRKPVPFNLRLGETSIQLVRKFKNGEVDRSRWHLSLNGEFIKPSEALKIAAKLNECARFLTRKKAKK